MIGTIELENIKLRCIIGELEYERVEEQDLFLDIVYQYDITEVVRTDDITQAVDYSELSEKLTKLIIESKFKLLETLCVTCCQFSLAEFPQIIAISIKAKKPDAIHSIEMCCSKFELTR